MNFEQPIPKPDENPISRREFLAGEWKGNKEPKELKTDGEPKDEIDKIVDAVKEKEISRRNLLTGKWFN